jgi:CheY-like chemotaxis protein
LPDVRTFRPNASEAVAALVAKCVRINPSERYRSAMEFLSALADVTQRNVSKRTTAIAIPPHSKFAEAPKLGQAPHVAGFSAVDAPLVFCVDDDTAVLDLVLDVLFESGCGVEAFPNGAEVLQRLRTKVPDLVLLDMDMPGMNGIQVCTAMRAQPRLQHVPVVFLTGEMSAEALQAALRAGATDYLFKPMQPAEVLARVQCLTRMRRAQQELTRLEGEYDGFQKRLSTLTGRNVP